MVKDREGHPSQVLRTSALVPTLKKPSSWLFLNGSQV
jgi:hypothetical protein